MKDRDDYRFAGWLKSLASPERPNRAALAHLRRGLGKPPGSTPEMFPLVERWVGHLTLRRANLCYLVASLFGLNQRDEEGNFGATCRKTHDGLRRNRASGGDEARQGSDSLEQRFVALLDAHVDDLPDHLRHAVALADSQDVGVNWPQLLSDLRRWDRDPLRRVQRKWANSYWRSGSAEDTEEQSTD